MNQETFFEVEVDGEVKILTRNGAAMAMAKKGAGTPQIAIEPSGKRRPLTDGEVESLNQLSSYFV